MYQMLLPRKDKKGMVPATEMLVATDGVRHLIRDRKAEQIPSLIQTGLQYGMHTFDMSLKELYTEGFISRELALETCVYPQTFKI